jgi:hypothetical protein
VTAINVTAAGRPACWVQPPLPGAAAGQIPHITAAQYSTR